MIDHIGISVGSIARATEFYLKALAPLGYGIVIEVSAEETDHGAAIASPALGRQPTSKAANRPSGLPSRAAVDVFYHAAIEAGAPTTARRAQAPLPRQLLRRHGNNIETLCHGPE